LQTDAYLSLPLGFMGNSTGAFSDLPGLPPLHDMGFLSQLATQLALKIENLYLLRRLSRRLWSVSGAESSRDLHDDVVQPYIGLKFGLRR
jgi:hypothetical protein